MVLGIGQDEKNGRLRFVKEGWTKGKEDEVNKTISDHVYQVEPIPNARFLPLDDVDGKFFMLLRVEPVIKDRPYILKGKGACYMRVGNSSFPANRDTIIALCKQTTDMITSIQMLKTITLVLGEQLNHIDEQAEIISHKRDASAYFIPELNLEQFIQTASLSIRFMTEHDLIDSNLVSGPERRHGFYTTINHLQELNGAIKRFNSDHSSQRGEHFSRYYPYWRSQHYQWILGYFDRINEDALNFLDHFT